MKLQELFNTNIPVHWQKADYVNRKRNIDVAWYGTFDIQDNSYGINITLIDDLMRISFESYDTEYEATGYGVEFQVFSVVVKAVVEFVKKYNPSSITFTAKGRSRQKLYEKMIKAIGLKLGYKLDDKQSAQNSVQYFLFKQSHQ